MELGDTRSDTLRLCSLIMHVNKISHFTPINRVASDLGETEDWLFDVAAEIHMGVGDRRRRRYGLHRLGVENLIEIIKMHKDDPTLLRR